MKKFLSVLLSLVLVFGSISVLTIGTSAASTTTLAQLQAKYPHGKYWNGGNANSYTSSPCTHHGNGNCSYNGSCGCNTFKGHGIQCLGFAYQLAYLVYGGDPYVDRTANKNSSALNSLKAGDVVRYKNNGHSIFVTAVNGDTVTYADCNSDGHCIIRWNQTISKSTLKATFTYVDPAPYAWNPGSGTPEPSLTVDTRYPTPFKCRIISTSKVQCYNNASKTSSPGYIYPDDDCVITEIYTNGLLKCQCPWSDGTTKTVYIDKSAFINSSMTPTSMSAPQYSTTYLRSDGGTSIGWIDPGDSITKVAVSGSYTQIVYPASQGKRCGWVPTSVLSTPDKVNYPTPFYCRIISTTKVPCYNDVDYTSSPGNIYPDDDCTITALYTNGKVQCLCPWSDGTTKTVYINSSAFFASTPTPVKMTAPKHASTYLRTSDTSSSWGWIDAGDVIYKLGTSGSMTQILYPTDSGKYRCGWVYTSDLKQTYTVSYNANGGTGAPSSQTKNYDVKLTLSSTVPIRNGYTFIGWATGSTATSAQYAPGGAYTANSGVTLYAVWKANQYNISYDANGGTGAPSPQTKTHGTSLTLSSSKPTREGYEFLGWSTSATATSATYKVGSSYTSNSTATLYAVWKANTYTISYDANGGSNAPSPQTKTYDIPLVLSSEIPNREGYTFVGWSIQSDKDDIVYTPGETIYFDSDTTLFAQWNEISINSISIETMPKKLTYKIGENFDPTGLKLKLTYDNGTTESVTGGFTTSGFSSATAGTKTITVSYSGFITSFTVVVEAEVIDENTPQIAIEQITAKPGETVEVQFKIQNAPELKSFSITGLTYDTSKLKFEKAVCNVEGVAISQVLPNGNAVVALNSNTDINGLIFTYAFTVKENIEDCSIPISCTFSAKEKPNGGVEQAVPFSVIAGEIVVKNYITGDLNGDNVVDSDDSIYLLWYTYLPDDYPINQNADFNGDGTVDSDDSIYLLWHTYLPEDYPLN